MVRILKMIGFASERGFPSFNVAGSYFLIVKPPENVLFNGIPPYFFYKEVFLLLEYSLCISNQVPKDHFLVILVFFAIKKFFFFKNQSVMKRYSVLLKIFYLDIVITVLIHPKKPKSFPDINFCGPGSIRNSRVD